MTRAASRDDPPTTVLATHHLEEIPTTATHAALLRDGRLATAGRAADVLTDAGLSACYGLDVVVERRAGRWWARAR
jgi:iron complex transport system ATP-binding protein